MAANASFMRPEWATASRQSSVSAPTPAHLEASLVRLETLAMLLDSAITIPGTKIAMGLDAVLGLVPVLGDAISGAIGSYIIWEARRFGAPRWLIARMIANTTLDTVIGSVPFVGDLFDVAFKSNRKNVALLHRHAQRHADHDNRTIETTCTIS